MMNVKHIKDNQYKIEHENGSVYLDANSEKEAVEIYNSNYTPLHDKKRQLLAKAKNEVANKLQATDYKVIRHRDQLELGVETTLTDLEYDQLLKERNGMRIKSNELETLIKSKRSISTLNEIKIEY